MDAAKRCPACHHLPPGLPGYFWTSLTVNAPWEPGSTTDQVVVGLGPPGLALYDRKTGIIHHMASARRRLPRCK